MTTSPPPRSSVALLEPRTAVSRELARERVIFWTAHRSRVVRRSGRSEKRSAGSGDAAVLV